MKHMIGSMKMKLLLLVCIGLFSVGFGNAVAAESADKYPSKPITVMIPWAAGSPSDNGARLLLPYVAEALGGANFVIINKPGASGWLGWDEVAAAKPDGYTIAILTLPSFYSGYMDPQNNRKTNLSDFQMIANQVSDWNVFYGQGGETRWKDMVGMLEYAKTHELIVGASGVGSDDNMVLTRVKKEHPEAKLTALQGTSSGNIMPMLLGKHIDMMSANLGDATPQVQRGELTALGLFAPDRSAIQPNLPTYKDLGLGNIIASSDRGYLMPKGVDPAILAKLEAAFEKGIKNPEHIAKMSAIGINVYYMSAKDLEAHAKTGEEVIENLREELGWQIKK
jgi:tripartite-type tricarboxylate transporter receptor subunit TctC